ncbi:MAG: hypothetical protein MJ113_01805 [Lachnospiraceae bacterium]|nr:hypothetical protein [Lachnospiraceae bacterium]
MDLFKFFRRKKKIEETTDKFADITPTSTRVHDSSARMTFFKVFYEAIVEAEQQNLEARAEYDMVTSYLCDIQKIETASEEKQIKLADAAKKLLNLHEDSKKYSRGGTKISSAHRKAIEEAVDKFPDEIKKMEENEKYQKLVEGDLNKLETEKRAFEYTINDSGSRGRNLKRVAFLSVVFMCLVAVLLLVLKERYQFDPGPYILVLFIAGVGFIWYLIFNARANQKTFNRTIAKMNKLIVLLNKIKIKYVNCTNALDYSYDKYRVNNSRELAYHWNQYLKVLEEERLLSQTSELISVYEIDIVRMLEKLEVADCKIWLSQLEALIDDKEMVEVRHRLNVRRQKLRSRIEYNEEQKARAYAAVRRFVEKYPEYLQEALNAARFYSIDLYDEKQMQ